MTSKHNLYLINTNIFHPSVKRQPSVMRVVFCKSYFEFAFNAVADGDGNIDGDGD